MNKHTLLITMALLTSSALSHAATAASYPAKTTLAGTEKIYLDDSGADKHATISTVWKGMALTGGLTASGSTAWNFSGSTAAFTTSTGVNTFSGSSHVFASTLLPVSNDAAALGSATLAFGDLFLASGGVINFNNGNVVLTHSSGVLTLGTGNLIITTAGTATGSVITNNGTQTMSNKTLTSPVISSGLTASGSGANDFSASTGTFKTSTGLNTFGGSGHAFAAKLYPSTDDGAALGDTTHHFSDLFLASGGVINFNNGNVALTHSSGILTLGTGELRITTVGTNAASVPTLGSTSTFTNKTLTSPVFGGSITGTYTLAGTPTITAPTITTPALSGAIAHTSNSATAFASGPNGGTNPVFLLVNNVSSAATGIKITGRAATAGADITVISSGTNEGLAIDAKGSGGITLNGTATGTITLARAVAASSTITQTSNSATAFVSGPNGGTNPVFTLVNNVSSAATGLSVTGRAAAAGVDLTVTSSGTNEGLNVEAKGSGSILLNGTATGAVYVGDRTTPALSVIHTTEGTGISVTSAAAASGAALAVTSSGTNENLTIDAKGSGTITLNGTATGAVTVNKMIGTPLTEDVTATNVITAAESGTIFFLNSGTEFVSTLPAPAAGLRFTFIVKAAPSGASYTIVTDSSANVIKGMQLCAADAAGDTGTADDTVTLVDGQAVAGDMVEFTSDGTSWFAVGKSRVAAGLTFTQASP